MALSKKKPAKAAAKKRNTLPLKRAKNKDGTFKGDDPSTPDVNEAYVGGKAPTKKKAKKAPAKKKKSPAKKKTVKKK